MVRTLLTKLANENCRDKHLSTILFSYKIAYKVATRYTPNQLMYQLVPTRIIHVNINYKFIIDLHVDMLSWGMFMIMSKKLGLEVKK